MRVLFVASLHHPEELLREQAEWDASAEQQAREPRPQFPSSMSLRFWERAMVRRGWTVDVFWRNLPAFGQRDIRRLKAQVFSQAITPAKVFNALMRRLPIALNPDLSQRNRLLIQHARATRPDILFLIGDNTIISAETVRSIKQALDCKVIYASGTSPIVFSHPMERQAARLYDLALVNDVYHGMQWLELGARDMACLPFVAIDPDFHQPIALPPDEARAYDCDLSFVGTLLPPNLYSERIAALEALRDFDLGIWSVHDVPDSLKRFVRGKALGAQMFRVLSGARISLNTHGDFMRYGGNMRLFECAALGAFQLVDDRPAAREWFTPDEHLVIYTSLDDLRDKVRYYSAHPEERQRIAAQARAYVLAHHTYEVRMQGLVERLAQLS